MTTTDIAIRLQVFVERYKTSQGKVLLRLTKAFDDIVTSLTSGEELSSMAHWELTRRTTLLVKTPELDKIVLIPYLTDLRNFVEAQIEIEANAWGVATWPKTAIDLAYSAPLGIDTNDRGKDVNGFINSWWETNRAFVLGTIRRAAFEGKSNSAIREDLRGSRRLNFNDGVLNRIRRGAGLANSVAIQHLLSTSRNVIVSLTDARAILWNSLFEKNVCARCKSLDSQPFALAKGPRSPLHPGCRCIMIPVFPDTQITEEKQSYFSWLRTQNFEFIEEALGKTRAQVFVDGGLSAERFGVLQLDKKFEPLTLDEFRAKAPSAFKRAGV